VSFDPTKADEQAEIAERMIRKLRAGMMPPPGARRPEGDVLKNFAASLESTRPRRCIPIRAIVCSSG
jgi:hypothetical protein